MHPSNATSKLRRVGWLVISVAGLCWGNAALADDHRGGDRKSRQQHSERYDYRSHYSHDHRFAHDDRRARHQPRHKHRHRDHHAGWHHHGGRYWAPATYRGRYCSDRRHYRSVHYHVAFEDYYEYYYPRYRHYGPVTPGASLIITVPLF